jgi:lysozyme family protein
LPTRRFPDALAVVLEREGGYVNDPDDPGGETNHGVAALVYARWRKRRGLPARSVRLIQPGEIAAIYETEYWDPVRGDELLRLGFGVALVVFDFVVNAGVGRATQLLQRTVSVKEDGQSGPTTMHAIEAMAADAFVAGYSRGREGFYERLAARRPPLREFLRGWLKRVAIVEREALRPELPEARAA